jgi:hypothetical protein
MGAPQCNTQVRHLAAPFAEFLRDRRNWSYVAYAAAMIPWLSGAMRLTALLLPVIALATARLTHAGVVHRVTGGILLVAALGRVAREGSQSENALNDPLVWGLIALATLGASAATGRWPRVSAVLAAICGACTATATLLPLFPDFESALPELNADASLRALELEIGPVGTMCLLAIWLQAVLTGPVRHGASRRVAAAARGALTAGLILLLAGGLPGTLVDARYWFAALGVLVGLVEAQVRGHSAAGRVRQEPAVG